MRLQGLLGLVLLCGCAAPAAGRRAGPLTKERLAEAIEAAGFRVLDLHVGLPAAVRPALPTTTIPYDDPALAGLRAKYGLEKVVEGAKDEWTAQLRLKEWVRKAIPGGNPRVRATRAGEILDHAAKGETFYCTHYAITYVECALALAWQARKIAVDRRHGPEGKGSTHHGVAEVWSNQHRKWAVIDPQSNLHFEKAGVPLSAWEIRAEWLKDGGRAVDHVVGVSPNATRKNPAIVWWDRPEDETATYFWLYIVDHAVAEGAGTKLFFPQDAANEGLVWYQNDAAGSVLHTGYRTGRFVMTSPEAAYWTVGVTEASVVGTSKGAIALSLDSHLPGRAGYEVSLDGRTWARVADGEAVAWPIWPGWNSFRARAIGPRGVRGPQSVLLARIE